MQKNIPLLPYWLCLVLFVIALALPNSSTFAARKHSSKRHTIKRASFKLKKHRFKLIKSITHCDRIAGKRLAFEMLNNSGDLSRLAGLKPDTELTPTTDMATNTGSIAEASSQQLPDNDPNVDEQSENQTALAEQESIEEGEEISELEQEDDVQVDIDAFKSLWLTYIDDDPSDHSSKEITDCGIARKFIMNEIMNWVGTTYVFGGTSRSGIDCSAFTRAVYAGAGNFTLPRTAATQWNIGRPIRNRSEMKFGDLVFFHTRKEVYVSHVGIYLGDNLFAHASSRYGVTVSSLESTYYDARLIGVRRIENRDIAQLATGNAKSYSY